VCFLPIYLFSILKLHHILFLEAFDKVDILLTVDVGDESWKGTVGVVTVILDEIPVDVKDAPTIVCGPPLMMKFVTQRLMEAGFKDENIFLSGQSLLFGS